MIVTVGYVADVVVDVAVVVTVVVAVVVDAYLPLDLSPAGIYVYCVFLTN